MYLQERQATSLLRGSVLTTLVTLPSVPRLKRTTCARVLDLSTLTSSPL
jgi:hypothetical protein